MFIYLVFFSHDHARLKKKGVKDFFLLYCSTRKFESVRVCVRARVVECLSILFVVVLIVLVGNILLAHLLSMKDGRKKANASEGDEEMRRILS